MFKNLFSKVKQTTQSTEELVEEIHHAFDTAGEDLLKRAKEIISNKLLNSEKMNNLKRFGFENTEEYKEYYQQRITLEANTNLYNKLTELNSKYPYKFITEAQVNLICKKYGLILGESKLYTGFIPEKNLKDIEKFFEKENPLNVRYMKGYWMNGNDDEITKQSYINAWKEYYRFDSREEKFDELKVNINFRNNSYIYKKEKRPLYIVAPEKEMLKQGYRREGFRLVKNVPDPVVLVEIQSELFCIVTAWGAEASDSNVVNEKLN